jgi:hypothetical protein
MQDITTRLGCTLTSKYPPLAPAFTGAFFFGAASTRFHGFHISKDRRLKALHSCLIERGRP